MRYRTWYRLALEGAIGCEPSREEGPTVAYDPSAQMSARALAHAPGTMR